MRKVNGVDVWIEGVSDWPYRIVSVIDDTRPGGPLPLAFREESVARRVKRMGGDGIILGASNREFHGFMVNHLGTGFIGTPMAQGQARYYVIRYAR